LPSKSEGSECGWREKFDLAKKVGLLKGIEEWAWNGEKKNFRGCLEVRNKGPAKKKRNGRRKAKSEWGDTGKGKFKRRVSAEVGGEIRTSVAEIRAVERKHLKVKGGTKEVGPRLRKTSPTKEKRYGKKKTAGIRGVNKGTF